MGNYRNKLAKCIICAGLNKAKEHYCGVMGCKKDNEKICTHIKITFANCGDNHIANSPRFTSWHKADVKIRKEKKLKKSSEKEKEKARSENEEEEEEREISLEPNTNMDLESEEWAQSLLDESFESPKAEMDEFYVDKSQNHSKNY